MIIEEYNCKFIKIDVTNSCNLVCPLCPNSYRRNKQFIPNKNMTLTEFKKLITKIETIEAIGFGVNNEPLLNKDIFEMIKISNEKNINTALFSNFTLAKNFKTEYIIKSGIKNIYIGLDGVDQKSYSKYRIGGNFNDVISSIKDIQNFKNKNNLKFPKIKIIFIVFKHNENILDKAKDLFDSLNISIFFRRTDFYAGFEDWFPLNFKQENFNKNRIPLKKSYNKKVIIKSICLEPFISVTINSFGNIYPCCGDVAFNFSLGNIFNNSFKNIWYSETIQKIRNCLQNKNKFKNIPCINCPIYKNDNNNIAIKT